MRKLQLQLPEEISSSGKAIVYHRTIKNVDLEDINDILITTNFPEIDLKTTQEEIEKIMIKLKSMPPIQENKWIKTFEEIQNTGLKINSGAYGPPGIYNTYSLKSQLSSYMAGYGKILIKSFLKLQNILILDKVYADKIYGNGNPIIQLKKFGSKLNQNNLMLATKAYNQSTSKNNYSSDQADLITNSNNFKSEINSDRIKGIVFTGRNDGQVLVAYNQDILVPIAWCFASTEKLQTKWFEFFDISVKTKRLQIVNQTKYSYDFNDSDIQKARKLYSLLKSKDINQIINMIEEKYLFPLMIVDSDYLIFKIFDNSIKENFSIPVDVITKLFEVSNVPLVNLKSRENGDNLFLRSIKTNQLYIAHYLIDNFKILDINIKDKSKIGAVDALINLNSDSKESYLLYKKLFMKQNLLDKEKLIQKLPPDIKSNLKKEKIILENNKFKPYRSIYLEDKYTISDLDTDKVYDMFSANYLAHTGKAWSKDKFLSRSQDYLFYGDSNGYVMVRPQRSGILKLTGSAGNAKSIGAGLKELNSTGKPVWGMVSKDMVKPSQRYGFISPPGWVIKEVAKHIPANVLGVSNFTINSDGSITIDYEDVGKATKYYIANKQYYQWLLDNDGGRLSPKIKSVIGAIVKGGIMWKKFTSYFSSDSD